MKTYIGNNLCLEKVEDGNGVVIGIYYCEQSYRTHLTPPMIDELTNYLLKFTYKQSEEELVKERQKKYMDSLTRDELVVEVDCCDLS